MKFCGRLDKNPQLSIRNIHDKKASEKSIIVYALPLSCTIKKTPFSLFVAFLETPPQISPAGFQKNCVCAVKLLHNAHLYPPPFEKFSKYRHIYLLNFPMLPLRYPLQHSFFIAAKPAKSESRPPEIKRRRAGFKQPAAACNAQSFQRKIRSGL